MNQPPEHSAGAKPAYRAYLIDGNGRVASSVAVMAENDSDAIRQAEAISHSGAVELWDRSRVIFRHAPGEHTLAKG